MLEASDFDYLSNEFKVTKGSIGIDLVSLKNDKLSIHIGINGVKFDRDVSKLRMSIATERVDIRLLENVEVSKKYIPRTSEQLSELIDEFKYKGIRNVSNEDILKFLSK